MGTTKSSHLQLRISPEQKKQIERGAKQAGMDMSAWVLSAVFPSGKKRFDAMLSALQADQADGHRRRYAFAALDDLFEQLGAVEFAQVVAQAPSVSLQPFAANYLAAMVEMSCHRKEVAAPAWAAKIRPLAEPYFGVEMASLRLYLLRHSPPPFRRRNIFIDTGTGGRL